MRFRLVAPLRRKGTSNSWFMKRIPVDVRERMAGLSLVVPIGSEVVRYAITPKTTTIRFSLRTSDPSEVKARQADAAAYFERLWASLRTSTPIALSHRQCVALSKDIFQAWVGEGGRTLVAELAADRSEWTIREKPFTPPEEWDAVLDALPTLEGDAEPEKLEATFGPIVDHSLRERGIAGVDEASRAMILREFVRALRDAITVQKRQASGDYSPSPEQARFPEWETPKPTLAAEAKKGTETASKSKVSLRGLVAKWWAEAEKANRSRSTHDNYNRTVKTFAAFLKHDDATRVTREDVVRFKDARVAGGAKLKTVADGDLVALKVVLGWAMNNGLISSNPAVGIKVVKAKAITTRPKGFTPEEATAILSKSLQHERAANENPKTAAAKRWVPWLCAYTGARVGEMVQLRKEDIRQEGDLWVLTITPEAGTVKDKEAREVVLHPHLIEMGFPAFVGASKAGPLFLVVDKPGEDLRGKWQATKNRLAEFARAVVPDDRVRPNHGWRHSFVTIGRQAGIEDSVLYAIGGWAPPTVGGRYGSVTLQAQAIAFGKFPRFGAAALPPSAG